VDVYEEKTQMMDFENTEYETVEVVQSGTWVRFIIPAFIFILLIRLIQTK
jgi:hypothetical protein